MKNSARQFLAAFLTFLITITTTVCSAQVLFDDPFMEASGLQSQGIKTLHMVTFVDDTCYAYLDDESVRTYDQNTDTMTMFASLPVIKAGYIDNLYSSGELADIVTHIVAGDDGLFGYNIHTGQFGIIDQQGIHWQKVKLSLDCLHPYGDEVTYRIARSFVTRDKLYLFVSLSEFQSTTEYALYSFSLADGSCVSVKTPDAVALCHQQGEAFFMLCQKDGIWSLQLLNALTGDVTPSGVNMEAFALSQQVCGLAYDSSREALYLASQGKAYVSIQGEAFATAGGINTAGCLSEASAWVLSQDRYALCSNYGVYITDPADETQEASQLTVQGLTTVKQNTMFRNAYPNTLLTTLADTITPEALAQQLLTQDTTVDVYRIKADRTYVNLKEKGMLGDVSESASLSAELDTLDPTIVQAITDHQGRMVAYPAQLSLTSFGVHQGYWTMVFGDRPLPKTFDDVMDAWLLWEQDDYAEDYPELDMWFGFDYQTLCQQVIQFYVETHDTGQSAVDMKASSLKDVLIKLAQIYALRLENGRGVTEWTPDESDGRGTLMSLFGTREAMYNPTDLYPLTAEDTLYDYAVFAYTSIPLTWGKDDPSAVNGELWVYIMNPYSQNKAEALNYLSCATSMESNAYLYYAIHPQMTQPYENPKFQKIMEDITLERLELLSQLSDTELDNDVRADMEALLAYDDAVIAHQEEERWLISEATIIQQRSLLNSLNLHLNSVYASALQTDDTLQALCVRYTQQVITLERFLSQLNDKIAMMYLESK